MNIVNPYTAQNLPTPMPHGPRQVHDRMQRSRQAWSRWKLSDVGRRAEKIASLADVLQAARVDLAETMTREMGKPITAAEAEIDKCATLCRHFATHGPAMLAPQLLSSDASRSYVRFEPLGAILGIMPWNFPYWQVFRAAIPALLVGNVFLLKHAPNVWGTAEKIEAIFESAGFEAGVMTNLLIEPQAVGALIVDPHVQGVTLTGSEQAGANVASQAGRAIRKCVMELGGSDPFIVLQDVDVPAVARTAAGARCINSGQSCIAAKRFIVHRRVFEPFVEAFVQQMKSLRVGDPMDRQTQVGPLARLDLLEQLERQVEQSLAMGAIAHCGGKRLGQFGFAYEPTVLGNISPLMPVWVEETFGPVAAVVRADDADHAIELANQSRFGLGASIWTGDIKLAESMAGRIEAGNVFVNGIVKSDPRLPFGGIKASGFGRELSAVGLHEFANMKTVWIA